MSEKSKVLVPIKAEETSDEQKALMLLLNEQICALFDQEDILLRPSPEMNRNDLWVHLKVIKKNPKAHVGYWLGARIDVDEGGYFWLNVKITVWPPNDADGNNIVFLTPNQTHWICDRLKENVFLRDCLLAHISGIVSNLRGGIERLDEGTKLGDFWKDTSKWNPVFDVVTSNAFRRGWYTSWGIFVDNVCPPPPWIHPDPRVKSQWNQIMQISGKVPTTVNDALESLSNVLTGPTRGW